MALGSVDEFKSRLTGGGARGNLFQVTLANPRGGLGVDLDVDFASFMCEAAQLPASTVGTITIPFRGTSAESCWGSYIRCLDNNSHQ
jgi:hypothetical protein